METQRNLTLFGPYYLLDQNVVLVTVNYRLGPFGFLSTGNSAAYGNAGMKDQVLALKWVQENIAQFGGDSSSVTIFGQSAGGAAVGHLIVSPASRGLFHRGISHSGSSLCWFGISDNAPELAYRTGSLFGCYGNSQSLVGCLQSVPAEQLVTAHLNLTDWGSFPIVIFAPVVEAPHADAFLSEHPADIYKSGQAARVPWITGFAKYELGWLFADFIRNTMGVAQLNQQWDSLGAIFLTIGNSSNSVSRGGIANEIRDFYLGRGNTEIGYSNRYEISQMLGDRYFLNCGLDGLYLHTQYTGESAYAYEFSFEGKYSSVQLYGQNAENWGVAHLDDIIYLLNSTEYYPQIRRDLDTQEYQMAKIMTATWANFATFGAPYVGAANNFNPIAPFNKIWKPIQFDSSASSIDDILSSFQFLDLNLSPRMVANPYVERYNLWNNIRIY